MSLDQSSDVGSDNSSEKVVPEEVPKLSEESFVKRNPAVKFTFLKAQLKGSTFVRIAGPLNTIHRK